MGLVMGTYRGKRYLPETLESLERNLKGCDEIVFVNDSGDLEVAKWLKDYGQVVTLPQVGFKKAMSVACSLMTPPYSAWWEEDYRDWETLGNIVTGKH